MFYLFTYGTLMKGFRNHTFLSSQKFIKQFKLDGVYLKRATNEVTGGYEYPVMFIGDNKNGVLGEIYECEDYLLPFLDALEGEGYLYYRAKFKAKIKNVAEDIFVYIGNPDVWGDVDMPLIESGKWEDFNEIDEVIKNDV